MNPQLGFPVKLFQGRWGMKTSGTGQCLVWHLTHTDLRVDFRIQKAMDATQSPATRVIGISFGSHAGYQAKDANGIELLGFVVPPGPREIVNDGKCLNGNSIIRLEVASKRLNLAQKIFTIPYATLKLLRLRKQSHPIGIYVHDFPLLLPGVIVSLVTGAKLIYDAHELNGHATGQVGLWSSLILFGQRLSWRRIDGFVTVSESIRDWFLAQYGPKKAIVITNSPMSVPSKSSTGREPALREKFGLDDDHVIFCYLGALEPGRNIDTLLRVFANPDRRSTLVFVGDGSLKDEILLVSESVASIRCHDPVVNWKISEILCDVDYGFVLIEPVSLSDRLSLPNKLFEYLDSGVRPIGTKLPEIARIIDEAGYGFTVDPGERAIEATIKEIEGTGRPKSRAEIPAQYCWNNQRSRLHLFLEGIFS